MMLRERESETMYGVQPNKYMTFYAFYMVNYCTQMIIYHRSENNFRFSSGRLCYYTWECMDAHKIYRIIIVIIWLTAKNQTFLMPSKHLSLFLVFASDTKKENEENLFFFVFFFHFWFVFVFSFILSPA